MAASASTPLRRIDRIEEPPQEVQEEMQRHFRNIDSRRVYAAAYPPATPELLASLAEAQAQVDRGELYDLDEVLAELGPDLP